MKFRGTIRCTVIINENNKNGWSKFVIELKIRSPYVFSIMVNLGTVYIIAINQYS